MITFLFYYDIILVVIKLEILFKNITTYSKTSYNEFLAFHRNKYRFKFILLNIIVIAIILTCIVYLVNFHIYSTAIIFCIFLTGFIFYRFIKPVSDVQKDYKEKIENKKTFTFEFYEHFFTIDNNGNIIRIKYKDLYKVFENVDSFYLYIDKTHAILINKSGFVVGNPSDFYRFIKKRSKSFINN